MGEAARDLRAVRINDRIPPHNLEAEQALLGSMFLSLEAVEGALVEVRAEDFSRPAHARIYQAMLYLHERSLPVDHVSVADRLKATNELDAVGGKPYLLDVTGVVPTTAHWKRYAEIVKRTSLLRQLIGA
ncbi:MAG: replicative DNA helicase, partial [Coriobacteriales bacterium]|nr:replicative DNA helicase [Coriobacteriales bacterium]